MAADSAIGDYMGDVARLLLGAPNDRLSTSTELRFGKQGSLAVDLEKGGWFDHEAGKGGGVLDLVTREKGLKGREAVDWLRGEGVDLPAAGEPKNEPRNGKSDSVRIPLKLIKTYDYLDESGDLVMQVCRYEPKEFRQRRPGPEGLWAWGLTAGEYARGNDGWYLFKGQEWLRDKPKVSIPAVRQIPYRLSELIDDISQGRVIQIVEGEKDVDNLRDIGIPATCNAAGAGKWPEELIEYFCGARIVLVPDNDPQARNKATGALLFHEDGRPRFPGKDHMDLVGTSLIDVAESVRVLNLPDLPPKGDATDWLGAGGTAEKFYELVETLAKPWEPPKPEPQRETRFGRIAFAELRTRKAVAPDFVVDDWMAAKEVSFLAGESEAGKTFLAIDVAMRISLGWPIFGRRTKAGLVIYQIGESAESLMNLRIPAWISHFGANLPDRVPFEILPAKINLWTIDDGAKNGVNAFLDAVSHIAADYPDLPLSAIVIDTLNKAITGGEENSGKDMGRVLANAELIAEVTGAHVAIVHHFPKGGTTLRGHSSLRTDANSVVMVSVDQQTKIRTITIDKLKDGEKAPMQFELMQVRLGERDDGKPITSCIVLPVGQKEAEKKKDGYRLIESEAVFFKAVLAAIDRYGQVAPMDIKLTGRADRWVEYNEVKRIYRETNPYDGEPGPEEDKYRNKMAMALKRARERLSHEKCHVIGCQKIERDGQQVDMIWWTGRPVRDFSQTMPKEKRQEPNSAADELCDGDITSLV